MEATSERWAEPELHRLRGRVLERSGAARGVIETCYRRAVESARERGMRSWELRAVASLAGSLQSQNCGLEARAELSAALDDLKELSDRDEREDEGGDVEVRHPVGEGERDDRGVGEGDR